jgi:hypothetical protein
MHCPDAVPDIKQKCLLSNNIKDYFYVSQVDNRTIKDYFYLSQVDNRTIKDYFYVSQVELQ